MKGNRYSEQYSKWLRYVQKHLQKQGYEKVAKHIGVTAGAIQRQCSKWRSQGIQIPKVRKPARKKIKRGPVGRPKVADGGTMVKVVNGTEYKYLKIDGKWVSQGRLDGTNGNIGRPRVPVRPKVVKPRKPREKKPKPVKPSKIISIRKAPKPAEKVLKTIVRNPDDYKTIRVTDKLSIQVRKGEDEQAAINRFLKKLEDNEKLKYKPSNKKANGNTNRTGNGLPHVDSLL